MCDVREIADGCRNQIESAGHEAYIRHNGKKIKAPALEPRPLAGKISRSLAEVRCGQLLREWNSSPPIVVVVVAVIAVTAIVIVTAPVVIAAVTTVVSETVDVADVTQVLLNLRPL